MQTILSAWDLGWGWMIFSIPGTMLRLLHVQEFLTYFSPAIFLVGPTGGVGVCFMCGPLFGPPDWLLRSERGRFFS